MSGEGKGGVAIAGAGLLGVIAIGARFCDDAARVGRFGGEAATVGRLGDDIVRASDDIVRVGGAVDDSIIGGRMASAGDVVDEGSGGRWVLDEADAVELTIDIGAEALGALEWDSGEVPLTPPITQLSGMWVASGNSADVPDAWSCDEPAADGYRPCEFFYRRGDSAVMVEGLLIVREGMICRSVLAADNLLDHSPAATLAVLNTNPCEQIMASEGTSLILSGPAGSYTIRWVGEE